jgi:hypothetical protein
MVQAHLAPAASAAISPKVALAPFIGEWYLETKTWMLGMPVVLGCHWALSGNTAKSYMCILVYTYTCMHSVLFVFGYVCTNIYRETNTR